MNAFREGTYASPGARLTYSEVYAHGDARDPLPEDCSPTIHRGEGNKDVLVRAYDEDVPRSKRVFLVKTDDPDRAYELTGKASKMLDHHGEGWGSIEFALILPRDRSGEAGDGDGVPKFKSPDPEQAVFVAIKKLSKVVIRNYLAMGGRENPYIEISRMQEIGDDVHVLSCIEALEDDDYLYIVTPYCPDGSLADNITWFVKGYPENEAQALFKNILEILFYLECHGINHHDIAPDNFLFLNGRLLLFDFAMSRKVPREEGGHRYLMKPQGWYGTYACQAPELYFNKAPFDGIATDLWSAAMTLYSLLTGQIMYRMPHPTDIGFRYFILARGLKPGFTEQLVEVLESAFRPGNRDEQGNLMKVAMANMKIPPDALELLLNLLVLKPEERWTLMDAASCSWVQKNMAKRRLE